MRDNQPMTASKLELSSCAVSVLGQLFVEGPTSDDNITSKAGRCDLVSAGLAFHEAGLSSLTPDGVRLARELGAVFVVCASRSALVLESANERTSRGRSGQPLRIKRRRP